eukprot:754622-Hanusia_phi.AAC.3
MEPSVVVAPRVRTGNSSPPSEVKLDRETLEPLFNLKQEIAAEKLGICLTSLKSACRKLGIQRWPYSRKGSAPKTAQSFLRSDPPEIPDLTTTCSASPSVYAGPSHTVSYPTFQRLDGDIGKPSAQRDYHISADEPQSPVHRHDCTKEHIAVKSEPHSNPILKQWIDWFVNSDDNDPIFSHEIFVPDRCSHEKN